MNRGQRTVASLLAVVAVLLGLNIVRSAPPAWGQAPAGTTPTPTMVNVAPVYSPAASVVFVFRGWSDGAVDVTSMDWDFGCSPEASCIATPLIPGSCTADANRNGEVEINDLLTMLGQWGPCE